MTIIKSKDLKGTFTRVSSKNSNLKKYSEKRDTYLKPDGFWISWNKGWEKWCKNEMPEWIDKKIKIHYKVEIVNKNLKIWVINSLKDLLELWDEFKKDKKIRDLATEMNITAGQMFHMSTILLLKLRNKGYNFWEWLNKEKKIDGIALTDKGQCDTRMNTFMYGLECETLFLFEPKNNIKLVKKIETIIN